jgi:PKD repeat protein
VSDELDAASRIIRAELDDNSEILRAAVAYTARDGIWYVTEMAETAQEDIYLASIPDADDLIYFVQAVDHAGNVTVADYKAYYNGPGSNLPVEADFEGVPLVGAAPLTVTFSNQSYGSYKTCLWIFGDGESSTECDSLSHVYAEIGSYTVTLTVSGNGGVDTVTEANYITVVEAAIASFTAEPLSGTAPLTVNFTNLSAGAYESCLWEFGDGESSTDCSNPNHVYTYPGSFSVTLTISGSGGTNILRRTAYITVAGPVDHGSKIYLPIIMRP